MLLQSWAFQKNAGPVQLWMSHSRLSVGSRAAPGSRIYLWVGVGRPAAFPVGPRGPHGEKEEWNQGGTRP